MAEEKISDVSPLRFAMVLIVSTLIAGSIVFGFKAILPKLMTGS